MGSVWCPVQCLVSVCISIIEHDNCIDSPLSLLPSLPPSLSHVYYPHCVGGVNSHVVTDCYDYVSECGVTGGM